MGIHGKAEAMNGMKVTSGATNEYNCISWAVGELDRRWWPDPMDTDYWPEAVAREESVESFIAMFQTLGYEICDNDGLEPGFLKVAIFIGSQGNPVHAARQLESGMWTSKLGPLVDVEHPLHHEEIGILYPPGKIAVIMRRRTG